jgi:L-malate glycosyltransferase
MKIMLYANGIGPVYKKYNRKLTSNIINLVDVITLRDDQSEIELKNLGVTKPSIHITADPAFSFDFEELNINDNSKIKNLLKKDGPFVGFAIREWSGIKGFEKIIANIADYCVEKYGLKPVFIPMQHPNDIAISNRIIKLMKNKADLIQQRLDVTQIYSIISKMDLLIGMRLHSLIYATKFGVPVIGLAYETKVDSFLHYIGLRAAGNIESLNYEEVIEMIDETLKNKERVKKYLNQVSEKLRQYTIRDAQLAIELLENRNNRMGD